MIGTTKAKNLLDGGGGTGVDQLFGGADADTFHFDRGEGTDIIKDFENNVDTIEFDNFVFETAEDALASAVESGDNVIFDFGADGSLIVENTTISVLANDIDIV